MAVGDRIGFAPSILWILSTMFIGGILLHLSPYTFMGNIMSAKMGKIDIKSANNASISYLLGTILLIVPGVLMLLYTLYLQMLAKIRPQQRNYKHKQRDDDVIDVEIIDE